MTANRPEGHVRIEVVATGTADPSDRDRWFHPDDGEPRRLGPKEQIGGGVVTTTDHSNCDHAWQQVTCDRCQRTYQCTPADDFYCAAAGDHCCEPCLIGGLPLHVVRIDREKATR